jgi:hypothetical protein
MIIDLVKDRRSFTLYFDGALHLKLSRKGLKGFQSWIMLSSQDDKSKGFVGDTLYIVEYYYRNGTKVLTEYDSRENWKAILSKLSTLKVS